ncbi:ABC transporter permease [Leucobacter rhizosphaerae]|uniref:ABC transporter permease n=1 Tax=Leucobacter rhizosphaerae TaxID=2932245 RepID=A0ABY4FTV8_9MICO|nr:ABC transporter permease [Leucobacter rhizosphaerae]UOQ59717.1 ABC transporter permease [Leucobacter rhizosphaerae]
MSGSSTGSVLLRGVLRRCAGAVVVLWAAITVTFVGIRAMPGSVEDVVLGIHANEPGLREQVRASLGLDEPVILQYFAYLGRVITGDFGRSYVLRADVSDVVFSQLGPTLQLAGAALLSALLVVWIVAVTTSGGSARSERALSLAELLAICLPTFWVGSLLIMWFSFGIKLFPASGADGLSALVLPTITLLLPLAGVLSQFMREEIGRQLRMPYIVSARSRGISEFRLRNVHLVPHAAVTTLTVAGTLFGSLIGGAVIVETVFGRPGLGRVALSAVGAQDTPVILAVVVLITTAYVVISTVVDLIALAIDPRLRKESA